MQAGRMLYRVTILRRAVVAGNPGGNARGDFAAAFSTRAALKQGNGFKGADAGVVIDRNAATLRVYDCAKARTITVADRVSLAGPSLPAGEWAIDGVSLPFTDRGKGFIEIEITQQRGG